jgi:hypothetical protein
MKSQRNPDEKRPGKVPDGAGKRSAAEVSIDDFSGTFSCPVFRYFGFAGRVGMRPA